MLHGPAVNKFHLVTMASETLKSGYVIIKYRIRDHPHWPPTPVGVSRQIDASSPPFALLGLCSCWPGGHLGPGWGPCWRTWKIALIQRLVHTASALAAPHNLLQPHGQAGNCTDSFVMTPLQSVLA